MLKKMEGRRMQTYKTSFLEEDFSFALVHKFALQPYRQGILQFFHDVDTLLLLNLFGMEERWLPNANESKGVNNTREQKNELLLLAISKRELIKDEERPPGPPPLNALRFLPYPMICRMHHFLSTWLQQKCSLLAYGLPLKQFLNQHNLFQAVIEAATCNKQRRTRTGQETDSLCDWKHFGPLETTWQDFHRMLQTTDKTSKHQSCIIQSTVPDTSMAAIWPHIDWLTCVCVPPTPVHAWLPGLAGITHLRRLMPIKPPDLAISEIEASDLP